MLFHWFVNRKTLSIITKIKCSHFDKIASERDTHTHTHTHTEEYYSARKTVKFVVFVKMWTDLENILLS